MRSEGFKGLNFNRKHYKLSKNPDNFPNYTQVNYIILFFFKPKNIEKKI